MSRRAFIGWSGALAGAAALGRPLAATRAFAAAATSPGPIYAFNVSPMTLTNVTIAGQTVDMTVTDTR
ncbi:glycoside hydrolase family 28 [Burkholderia ambifaria]|uniref:glycoside hydrolase family 28 n=1 Tax=Burkholderia ambifaria TaxID=152480 RepID=UPI001588D4B4|nr:glycoside hydrolase family 28 [Burkholderia ambifaria]